MPFTIEEVLKKIIIKQLTILKKDRQKEYEAIFKEIISQNELYQNLPQTEKEHLIKKAGLLGLSVVSSLNWMLQENKLSSTALEYLKKIQSSDGTLSADSYWNLVDVNAIADDQLTPKLIRILSNNHEDKKEGLSGHFHALPDNLDQKPYKDDYMKFCTDSTRKIMGEVIKIIEEIIEEKPTNLRERSPSWREKLSPTSKKAKKHVTFAE